MTKVKINRVCPQCGKVHNYSSKDGYCEKHYYQMLRFGKFLDNSPRSIYDSNEYRVEGSVTFISVYDKYGNKLPQEVLIDTEDIPVILKYKVYIRLHKRGSIYYAYCNIGKSHKEKIHRMLCESTTTVDHINGNTLDNRKCNLRSAGMTMQNLNKIGTDGIQKQVYTYKGQYIVKGYAATLCYHGKRYISKYYKTKEEAKYYRYLLLQLLPFETNYNLAFMEVLTKEQMLVINKNFENRFKNRVL